MVDKIKIGYAIANIDLQHPAYRRRFCFYAQQRNLNWEIADFKKKYDIIVVHHSADLTLWYKYEDSKIIFDYNDDYLAASDGGLKAIFRGTAKFLTRQYKYLELDYSNAYIKMMKKADAVVCSTNAQEEDVRKYCLNIHQILDMQSDKDWITKSNYNAGKPFNIVWEGFPDFLGIKSILPLLAKVKDKENFNMHIVTAIKYGRFLMNLFPVHSKDKMDKIFPFKDVFLYEWNKYLISNIVTSCDLAIIPIAMDNPFWVSKPANKLLFFWRMGMPVLTSPTPEYKKIMEQCGIDMICYTPEDWEEKLINYMYDKKERTNVGLLVKKFVENNYNENKLLSQWDNVFESVL